MNKKDIEREIEKTIRSLDGLDHAQTDSFFFTRLQARLDVQNASTLFGKRQLQWILAVLTLLLCINIFSYVNFSKQGGENIRMKNLESFATNYGWENYNLYDFNEIKK